MNDEMIAISAALAMDDTNASAADRKRRQEKRERKAAKAAQNRELWRKLFGFNK